MKLLNKLYQQRLKEIAAAIQESDTLAAYLEEEDEALYKTLTEEFEPELETLYDEVAQAEPLQLFALEDAMLSDEFEGLFLPRLLGYNVLRGEVNDRIKYTRSQERFGKVLHAICESANFEPLRRRIGQSVQIGFALSSDIWITGFVDRVQNKKIAQFLMSQKLEKYMHEHERRTGYRLYSQQFDKFNYHTTEFPTDLTSQQFLFHSMSAFLKARAVINEYNQNFIPEVIAYLEDEQFHFTREHTEILGLLVNYFDMKKTDLDKMSKILNKLRDADDFNEIYFSFLLDRFNSRLKLTGESDKRVASLVDFAKADDDLTRYYTVASELASKGYIHDDVIEKVREIYGMYEGMSLFSDCLRNMVLGYFSRFLQNIEPGDYHEYFELNKYLVIYMDIFSNQQFNQHIKELCYAYVKKLIRTFTDKRGRDYQDIKKFASAQFVELQFMKEKDVVELFKTKRKKATA